MTKLLSSTRGAVLLLGLSTAALATGCGRATSDDGAGGADGGVLGAADGGRGADGAVGTIPTGGGDAGFCGGSGPIVVVGDADGGARSSACTGQIAEATFKSALCTCHDASLQGYLRTRGFDSTPAAPDAGAAANGAPVGINHDYIPALVVNAGFTDVAGSFAVAGPDSIAFAGELSVEGDFRAAGTLSLAGYTRIARDAWIGGDVTNAGYATVAGDLHITGNDVLPLTTQGTRTKQTVTVAPPCACDSLLDVGSLVDYARTHNDDAAIALSPTALQGVLGAVDVHLPCGKYYVEDISGIGDIQVHVDGRVALFVEGSITATGNLEFDMAPGAEIDIFVKGTLVLTGRGAFGSKDHPASTRIYVGGTDDVTLIGASGFVGNLYAPRARVTSVGYAKVYGSVFARDFEVPGYADISFDRAITHAGDGCSAPPPGGCTRCGTCTGGTACVAGNCGACVTDADCCGQDTCVAGVCGGVIIR